jgi:hypothetical protein
MEARKLIISVLANMRCESRHCTMRRWIPEWPDAEGLEGA